MNAPSDFAHYHDLVAGVIAGKPWICAQEVLVPAAASAERLLALGASRVLALGGSRGTGVLPDPARIAKITLGTSAGDMMSAIRNAQAALAALPPEVQQRVDDFDPGGEARVLAGILAEEGRIAGRRVYGGRPASWQRLEDKTAIDEVWDTAGLTRAPSRVVCPESDVVHRAADEVAHGEEYVISGDSREGFNGGAQYVRWIRRESDLPAALEFFAAHCDRVRVMPLLEGIPCSIHGIIFPDHIAVLRPCELLVFRDQETPAFEYAGADTFWDAPAELAGEMTGAARKLGAYLAESCDYRGTFTLDGVATPAGFRPTEVNARVGAALTMATASLEQLPLALFNGLLVEGEALDFRGLELEALLLEYLEANRAGKVLRMIDRKIEEQKRGRLRLVNGEWQHVGEKEPADFTYILGPSSMGGVVLAALDPDRTPRGPSAAERAASAMRFLDGELELGFGAMEAPV